LWKDVLGELGITLGCLLVTRHPLDVAKSLERRDGFPVDEGLTIWLNYNLAMLESTSDLPRVFITYDQLLKDWKSALTRCSSVLHLPPFAANEEIRRAVDNAIRKDLRHSASTLEDLARAGCPAPVRELAEIIDEISRNGTIEQSGQERIQRLIEAHSSASDLYRHDVLRPLRRARSLERHSANLENVRASQLRENNRLLEESKVLHSDVQRLMAANVALNDEVRSLRTLLQERSSSTTGEAGCLQELMQANEEARLLIEQKNRQLLEQDVQLEKQRHQNARQGGEVSSIQRSLEERAREIERLQKEVDELRRCLAESEERLQQTVAQVKTLAGSLDDVYASQSWRITQPLRMVYDMLRLSGRRGP
jgi:hypothetical protein